MLGRIWSRIPTAARGGVILSSGFTHETPLNRSFEWFTPPWLFDKLGVEFDLDPCSPGAGKSFVPAKRHLTIDDDGLATEWAAGEFVFCNPPYGNLTKDWVKKCSEHGNAIVLVFARTDVKWFQDITDQLTAVCFIAGRVKFYRGNTTDVAATNPGAGSMLLAFGDKAKQAVEQSGLGAVFVPVPRM